MNIYRSRWDIKTFFKYMKSNFKIQHTREQNIMNIKKNIYVH